MNNSVQSRVGDHPFFSGMKPEHVKIIEASATETDFAPDQMLFREGEPATKFYLIEIGRIALEAHDPADGTALVQYLGPGDVLGWSWLFPPYVWHFQAHAVEPVKAIILDGTRLLIAAERYHDFGYELMKRVAQVLIRRLQTTRKQLLAESNPHGTDEDMGRKDWRSEYSALQRAP